MGARGIDSARARGDYGCTMSIRLASGVEPAGHAATTAVWRAPMALLGVARFGSSVRTCPDGATSNIVGLQACNMVTINVTLPPIS
jgi:hypothetical protein